MCCCSITNHHNICRVCGVSAQGYVAEGCIRIGKLYVLLCIILQGKDASLEEEMVKLLQGLGTIKGTSSGEEPLGQAQAVALLNQSAAEHEQQVRALLIALHYTSRQARHYIHSSLSAG